MRRFVAACAVCFAVSPALADELRYALRVEAGGEYDTNPARVERISGALPASHAPASPAGRLLWTGDLLLPLDERVWFAVTGGVAGKRFSRADARGEDVLVAHATGAGGFRFGGRSSLSLTGAYYDVFQAQALDARDFRSATPALRLDLGLTETASAWAGGGHRWFTFKPQRDFDFAGPTVFAGFRQAIWPAADGDADWDWSTSASVELRAFAGTRCLSVDECPGPASAGRRDDRFWVAQAEITRTGDFLLGLGLSAHLNQSNSFGERLVRGLGHVRATVLLPWQLALSTRAELVATSYRDEVPLAWNTMTGMPQATIEDESRSTLRVELVRPAGRHLDVGGRYTLYTNELRAGPIEFRRQTFLLFVAFVAER